MKFKVGDKIKHKDFGVGEIVYINEEINKSPYAVQFETFNKNLHSLGIFGAPKVKMGHGMWCKECDLELDKQPHNLIPQIAKMLGVEIGEEFKISNIPDVYKFTEDGLIGINSFRTYIAFIAFFKLISGKEKIIKLPQKPLLTEDEKAILRNLPKENKWIARDKSGALYIFKGKPYKERKEWYSLFGFNELNLFQHLFQFIKWEDEEPYNIKELLKGE